VGQLQLQLGEEYTTRESRRIKMAGLQWNESNPFWGIVLFLLPVLAEGVDLHPESQCSCGVQEFFRGDYFLAL